MFGWAGYELGAYVAISPNVHFWAVNYIVWSFHVDSVNPSRSTSEASPPEIFLRLSSSVGWLDGSWRVRCI